MKTKLLDFLLLFSFTLIIVGASAADGPVYLGAAFMVVIGLIIAVLTVKQMHKE